MVNIGGVNLGRYIRPHIGGFIGPLPVLGSVSRNQLVRAKQPRYPYKPLVRPWIGPYPVLGSVSHNLLVRAKQPRYPYKPHTTQILGTTTSTPVGVIARVVAKQPRYPYRVHVQPWIGPYPRLGSVSRNALVVAKQPPYRIRLTANTVPNSILPQPPNVPTQIRVTLPVLAT